jgi:hypothetical protein
MRQRRNRLHITAAYLLERIKSGRHDELRLKYRAICELK